MQLHENGGFFIEATTIDKGTRTGTKELHESSFV